MLACRHARVCIQNSVHVSSIAADSNDTHMCMYVISVSRSCVHDLFV